MNVHVFPEARNADARAAGRSGVTGLAISLILFPTTANAIPAKQGPGGLMQVSHVSGRVP
jgi:hypothetical protein